MPILNWIGKNKIINHHQEVPYKVLDHKYGYAENGESKTSTGSGNLIINGDNLEALKSLLPKYEGKVNCIYIDPPYNTGNEGWVYNDNVNSPQIKKWFSKVVGKESEDLTRHDKWLCMMYPRLKLLHKLLAKDGAIFISIDDNEQATLKLMMDEIFGNHNYLGLITRKQSSGSKNDTGDNKVITTADYILTYKKKDFTFLPYQIKNNKKFNLKDEIGLYSIRALEMQGGGDTLSLRNKMGYSVYYHNIENKIEILFDYNLDSNPVYMNEDGNLLSSGYRCYRPRKRGLELGIWRWGSETFIERFKNNLVHFDNDKVYIKEREAEFVDKYPEALLDQYLNTQGTNELKAIFDTKTFDFPKPSELLKFLFSVSTNKNSIILDSFAGSGTTAHAVLNLNKQDGGNRKFILIEMEDYAETITAERVKRVIKGYGPTLTLPEGEGTEAELKKGKQVEGTGGSFDYYTLGETLFNEENNLNENISEEVIKEYIWFTETRTRYSPSGVGGPYLGTYNDTSYYFIYEKEHLTTLDYDALAEYVKHKAERYIIYADNCLLPEHFMRSRNIEFKKIPRDITRF